MSAAALVMRPKPSYPMKRIPEANRMPDAPSQPDGERRSGSSEKKLATMKPRRISTLIATITDSALPITAEPRKLTAVHTMMIPAAISRSTIDGVSSGRNVIAYPAKPDA
jgi:hypothetical protein